MAMDRIRKTYGLRAMWKEGNLAAIWQEANRHLTSATALAK
jgi:hypothetical protein